MNWKIAGLALMSLACAAQAASTTADAPAAPAAPAKAEAENDKRPVTASDRRLKSKKMRCVTEQVTGSRFAKRVCHTEEEWARIQESGVEAVKNIQSKPIPLEAE